MVRHIPSRTYSVSLDYLVEYDIFLCMQYQKLNSAAEYHGSIENAKLISKIQVDMDESNTQ